MPNPRKSLDGELVPTRRSLLERLRDVEDHVSWQEFFDIYWRLIYKAAIKQGLSDADAQEVVQETVIGIARKMEDFCYDPAACSFKGWLMVVTRRRIVDHWRRRHHRRFLPLETDGEAGDAPPPGMSDSSGFEEMWTEEWKRNLFEAASERVKRKVKPEHYQIFYLQGVKEMAVRDICALLRVSTAKVYVVCHRVSRQVKLEMANLEKNQVTGITKPEKAAARC